MRQVVSFVFGLYTNQRKVYIFVIVSYSCVEVFAVGYRINPERMERLNSLCELLAQGGNLAKAAEQLGRGPITMSNDTHVLVEAGAVRREGYGRWTSWTVNPDYRGVLAGFVENMRNGNGGNGDAKASVAPGRKAEIKEGIVRALADAGEDDDAPKLSLSELVVQYQDAGNRGTKREQLGVAYEAGKWLIELIAQKLIIKLPPSVAKEELMSAGFDGFVQAANTYDGSRGIKFDTYAAGRIRGAMLDYLREIDPVARKAREQYNEFERVTDALRGETGREPSLEDVLARAEISHENLRAARSSLAVAHHLSLDCRGRAAEEKSLRYTLQELEDHKVEQPFDVVSNREAAEYMTRGLTRKEKRVLVLYYTEGMTMGEIGAAMDLSESRVCQIHAKVLSKLRTRARRAGVDVSRNGRKTHMYKNRPGGLERVAAVG